jgi:hypothetical protein
MILSCNNTEMMDDGSTLDETAPIGMDTNLCKLVVSTLWVVTMLRDITSTWYHLYDHVIIANRPAESYVPPCPLTSSSIPQEAASAH